MKTSYIRSTLPLNLDPDKASEYFTTENVCLGMETHKSLQTLQSNTNTKADEQEVKIIYKCACKLYVEVVKHIKQQFLFEAKLFNVCDILNLTKALDIGAIDLLQKILP
jgi:hypothetical protein